MTVGYEWHLQAIPRRVVVMVFFSLSYREHSTRPHACVQQAHTQVYHAVGVRIKTRCSHPASTIQEIVLADRRAYAVQCCVRRRL